MAMRNGDFSAVAQRIYDPLTGNVDGTGRVAVRRTTSSRRTGSARSRGGCIGFIPEPNIAGAPLGQNNYQKAQTREKTTDGFDTKVNCQRERQGSDCRTASASCVRWSSTRARSGIYGGPANGGFAGTGTNTSISTAGTWTARSAARRCSMCAAG